VIEKVRRLMEAARAAGMPVIHVRHLDSPGHVDSTRNAELFREIIDANGLVRGTWGASPVRASGPKRGISSSRSSA
jgi:gluconolactonase